LCAAQKEKGLSYDPFDTQSGYDPDRIHTTHGDRGTESKQQMIKFDPVVFDQVYNLFINNDRYGDYKSLSDFVADACHHRMHYLMSADHGARPTDVRQAEVWGAAANESVTSSRVEAREKTVVALIAGMARHSSLTEGDAEALHELILAGNDLLPQLVNGRLKADLSTAVTNAERTVRMVHQKGQQELRAVEEAQENELFGQ